MICDGVGCSMGHSALDLFKKIKMKTFWANKSYKNKIRLLLDKKETQTKINVPYLNAETKISKEHCKKN